MATEADNEYAMIDLAFNKKAADWVRNNVLEFTKGTPEVMVGNTLIAEVNSKVL